MRAPVVRAALVAAILVGVAPTPAAQEEESHLLVGTWVLDLAHSRYRPGPPLRAETRVYTNTPEGIRGVIRRTHADGREEVIEYVANTDREYMVSGTSDYDAVLLQQVGPRTWEARLSHGGSVFGRARRVIAADGKSMTITFWRPELDVRNVAVYVRK